MAATQHGNSSLAQVLRALDLGDPRHSSACPTNASRSLGSPTSSLNALSSPADASRALSKDARGTFDLADGDLTVILEALRKARNARGEEHGTQETSASSSTWQGNVDLLTAILLGKASLPAASDAERQLAEAEEGRQSRTQSEGKREGSEGSEQWKKERINEEPGEERRSASPPPGVESARGAEEQEDASWHWDRLSKNQAEEDGALKAGQLQRTGPVHNPLYKTELCRSFEEFGTCRYGNKCQFAHGADELRPVQRHPKYKTEICRTFATTGTCPYGTRCRFIHQSDTLAQLNAVRNSSSNGSGLGQPGVLSTPKKSFPLEPLNGSPLQSHASDILSVLSASPSPQSVQQLGSIHGGHQSGLASPYLVTDPVQSPMIAESAGISVMQSGNATANTWQSVLKTPEAVPEQAASQKDKKLLAPSISTPPPSSLGIAPLFDGGSITPVGNFSTPPPSPLPGAWANGLAVAQHMEGQLTTPMSTPLSDVNLSQLSSPSLPALRLFAPNDRGVEVSPMAPSEGSAACVLPFADPAIPVADKTIATAPNSVTSTTPTSARRLPVFSKLVEAEKSNDDAVAK